MIIRFLIFIFVVVLWSGCFVYWIKYLSRDQVDPRTWTDCKLEYFLFHFGRHYSSMLLVLMSAEKCYAVYFPLKSKTVCTVKTAKWLTGIVGMILAGYNLVCFFLKKAQLDETKGLKICVVNDKFKTFFEFYFMFDSVLYSFGPFALMFITNFAIVLKFMTAKCTSSQNSSTESINQALVKAATKGTAMVVTVSVTFLILTAPGGVNYAIRPLIFLSNVPEYRIIMNITTYLNHSINGLLYCIVGTRFRRELFKLFCRNESETSFSSFSSGYSTRASNVSNINKN